MNTPGVPAQCLHQRGPQPSCSELWLQPSSQTRHRCFHAQRYESLPYNTDPANVTSNVLRLLLKSLNIPMSHACIQCDFCHWLSAMQSKTFYTATLDVGRVKLKNARPSETRKAW